MEDPYLDMEGAIEEYSAKESGGKVRWILNKGLTIGKKMLVTGFVVSSAPVVLPPLVVMSFFGLACSVPYGIFLASYACTDKLMSKLFPGSKPPPFLLEYGKVLSTYEEVENDEYGEGELGKDSNEIVEENGYEEDVGEHGIEKEEVRGEKVGLKGDTNMEKEEEEISEDTTEMVEMRIELVEKGNDEVDEKRGGVGKDVQEIVRDSNEIVEENGYEEDVGDYKDEKVEVEVIIEGVGEEEETEPMVQESWDQMQVDGVQAIVVDIEREDKIGGTAEGTVAPFEVTNIPIVEIEATKVGNNRKEEQKPGVNKPSTLQARGANDKIANKVQQNNQFSRKKENVIFSNADAIEISDESGFDLFDEKDAASHQFSDADNNSVQGNEQSSSYMSPDVDFTALPVFAGEHIRNEAGISSKEDIGMASTKALYSEEKIWEQIDAMRRIVGYKAASKRTSIEELKALYLFTGVEPPTMFKDPSDLEEVNHKLRFLMSIVGVK